MFQVYYQARYDPLYLMRIFEPTAEKLTLGC